MNPPAPITVTGTILRSSKKLFRPSSKKLFSDVNYIEIIPQKSPSRQWFSLKKARISGLFCFFNILRKAVKFHRYRASFFRRDFLHKYFGYAKNLLYYHNLLWISNLRKFRGFCFQPFLHSRL